MHKVMIDHVCPPSCPSQHLQFKRTNTVDPLKYLCSIREDRGGAIQTWVSQWRLLASSQPSMVSQLSLPFFRNNTSLSTECLLITCTELLPSPATLSPCYIYSALLACLLCRHKYISVYRNCICNTAQTSYYCNNVLILLLH